jgi:hypothetical protein
MRALADKERLSKTLMWVIIEVLVITTISVLRDSRDRNRPVSPLGDNAVNVERNLVSKPKLQLGWFFNSARFIAQVLKN